MSRSVIGAQNVGSTAPESLFSLQRRLQAAEQQSEELVKGLGFLGVSADHLPLNTSAESFSKHPDSPVNIHRPLGAGGDGLLCRRCGCETLVSRVCRLESLLHALKLATFRLETDRELNPSHTARLQEQLNTLQCQYEEEQRSSQREMLQIQDRLQQACEERKEAQQEVLRLRKALESTMYTKMKEREARETAAHLEAEQSHNALLLKVKEMEKGVEKKSGQVKALEADCHALRVERQANKTELKQKKEQILSLERECQQLKDHFGVKETLISELSKEIKSLKMSLQKQNQENSRLVRDGRDLRAAADEVQVLNNKLEVQCSGLNATVQSLIHENTRLQTEYQNNIKAERDCVSKHMKEQDLLLDTARRNVQVELQSTISEKLTLEKQLEVLKEDHAKLQQSSSLAQQRAVNHQQILGKTIARLQEELSCALREEETRRKERDQIKSEMSSEMVLLEKQKNLLETQLSDMKVESTTLKSALQRQEKENRALMESLAVMQHQQVTHRQVEQMLWELTDSKNKLAYKKGKLQAQVQQMGEDLKTLNAECAQHCQINITLQNSYTQIQRENHTIKEHLLILQQHHRDTNEVVETLEKVLSSHAVLQHNTQTLQAEMQDRTQELQIHRREKLQAIKEIQKLKAEVEHLQKLTHTTSTKVESLQKALDEAQLDNKKLALSLKQILQDNHEAQEKLNTLSQREEELKEARAEICQLTEHVNSLKKLLKMEKDSGRKSTRKLKKAMDVASAESRDLTQANHKLQQKVAALEKLVSSQMSHLYTRIPQNSSLRIKHLEESLKWLQDEGDEAEVRHRKITDEDHRDFCCTSESFEDEFKPQKLRDNLWTTEKDCTSSTPAQDKSNKTQVCIVDPELEPWAFTLQRWEIKKNSIASGSKPTRPMCTQNTTKLHNSAHVYHEEMCKVQKTPSMKGRLSALPVG
ncbi:coiled-coil domain-containing protein 150 isoform X2 [Misgurnus anguillicaudatus]|uniref:coiled-coil domain-containing protein 150 isoform X2 n=1 Tax=Misgurnus anguillicaudatus TaxID=75329 RepID=UPI003CCF4C3D